MGIWASTAPQESTASSARCRRGAGQPPTATERLTAYVIKLTYARHPHQWFSDNSIVTDYPIPRGPRGQQHSEPFFMPSSRPNQRLGSYCPTKHFHHLGKRRVTLVSLWCENAYRLCNGVVLIYAEWSPRFMHCVHIGFEHKPTPQPINTIDENASRSLSREDQRSVSPSTSGSFSTLSTHQLAITGQYLIKRRNPNQHVKRARIDTFSPQGFKIIDDNRAFAIQPVRNQSRI